MDRFKIEGGRRLEGTVRISGSKNASLPAMAAALLTSEPVRLQNIPGVRDIITMAKLLAHMRARVESPDLPPSEFTIAAETISHAEAPYELVKTMRASILTLGPLVGALRFRARFAPWRMRHWRASCRFAHSGARKNGRQDFHGSRLRRSPLQAPARHANSLRQNHRHRNGEYFDCGGLAEGETVLTNAAREPEVTDLIDLLIKMGAKIEGRGTSTLHVHGVDKLHGATHAVIPDRIEAGTFIVAAAITGGDVKLTHCAPQHLTAVIETLAACGVEIQKEGVSCLRVRAPKALRTADITTEEYPGFATDMQAQFMALATQAEGKSEITETIFENRFMHAQEMIRMGANIAIDGHRAVVQGPTPLSGLR